MRRVITFMIFFTVLMMGLPRENAVNGATAESSVSSADLTSQCKFRVSSGSANNLYDGTTNRRWEPKNGSGKVSVELPDTGAVCFELQWTYAPENFTITQYDADQNVISTRTRDDDDYSYLSQLYDLDPNTRFLNVAFKQSKQGIAEMRFYGEGTLPATANRWEKPLDKCDLLVLSTHYDDEWLWFGAIIPYYALVQKKNVQVVYMANCGRRRAQEALNGLAVAGTSVYPHFVRLKDEKIKSYKQSLKDWGGEDKLIGIMTEFIRRFKPEVILTHDWNGEYGHNQHKLTSHYIGKAILAAADPSKYPESYKKYGTWQTKKLYSHLWDQQVIQFDWHTKYDEFGGLTGIELAVKCMNEHKSQLNAYQVQDGGKYDNSLFGLAYSTVGDDVEHNDLFENITYDIAEADRSASVPDETEATPVAAVSAQPTAASTNVPRATSDSPAAGSTENSGSVIKQVDGEADAKDASENAASDGILTDSASEHKTEDVGIAVWIVAGVCVTGGAVFALCKYRQTRKRRRRKRKKAENARHASASNGANVRRTKEKTRESELRTHKK